MTYDLTVIIPVYNMENLLSNCLDSIVEQNKLEECSLRVICVNDGSTDNSKKIIEEYSNRFSFIELLNKENGGVYLDKEGCKKFIAEFEKRLRQEVGYVKEVPYKMSFRRIIEYQIMQLIKAIEEDNPNLYSSILIR